MVAPLELRGGLRILVVDDHRTSAEILGILLRRLGHQVETANDGKAALGVAESFRPEIALLDLVLPDMDGHEVSRRLREMDFPVRVLALSGRPPDQQPCDAIDEHLMKPVSLEALQGALERWSPGARGC
jgi:CheY-like chemotaxis protein